MVYGGRKAFQIINFKLTSYLPHNIQTVPYLPKAISAVVGIVAADALLPRKYATLAGIGLAEEVVESLISPTLDPMLAKNNLISATDAAKGLLTANPPAAPATPPAGATNGYARMGGYAPMRGMGGYASMRGMGNLFPVTNAFGL
jgi:hypothetical protein